MLQEIKDRKGRTENPRAKITLKASFSVEEEMVVFKK